MEYVRVVPCISAKYYYGIITSFIESHTIPVLSSSLASCRSAALGDCADMVMYWPGMWTVYSVILAQPPSILLAPVRMGSCPGHNASRHPGYVLYNALLPGSYGNLPGLLFWAASVKHPAKVNANNG
jgi:hypothetical protein